MLGYCADKRFPTANERIQLCWSEWPCVAAALLVANGAALCGRSVSGANRLRSVQVRAACGGPPPPSLLSGPIVTQPAAVLRAASAAGDLWRWTVRPDRRASGHKYLHLSHWRQCHATQNRRRAGRSAQSRKRGVVKRHSAPAETSRRFRPRGETGRPTGGVVR